MQKTILKLNYPLSNKGLFIEVEDPTVTLDTAIQDAVKNLRDQGKNLESSQLESLYQTHQVHVNGTPVSKGALISSIPTQTHNVNGQTIQYQELMLLTEHVGGTH